MVSLWLQAALPLAGLIVLLLLLWPVPQSRVQSVPERPLLHQGRWPAPPADLQVLQPGTGRPVRKAGA